MIRQVLSCAMLLLASVDLLLSQTLTPARGGGVPGEQNEIAALRNRILNGFAAGENFATSASIAGDLNGDGYADIIVGAPGSDVGGTDRGRAYIFFGGPGMATTPDLTLEGTAANDYFGFCVAGAGDVNADGYADVIVGAPFADPGGTNSGAAYVYFGGSWMNSSSDLTLLGQNAGDEFGRSVASAGDFNGDGYDDIIVGAWRADGAGSDAGMAYLYYGGSFPEGVADRTFSGTSFGDLYGVSVAGVGDMDADGYEDVAIGAEGATGGSPFSGPSAGRVVIHFGDNGGPIHRLIAIPGTAPYDYFGHSVAGAGDVNGDGYADAIVGAYGNDNGGIDAGRATIYHGGSFVDGVADRYLNGRTAGEYTGISVSSVGDLNGDGYSDVIVGAHLNDMGADNAGQARVYCGGAGMDAVPDTWITGTEAGEVLGYSVTGGGDVNGDGYDDYCVGAYRNDAHGIDAGRLYIYSNTLTGEDYPDIVFRGLPGELYGAEVSGIGDVNNDSYDDFAVSPAKTDRYTPDGHLVHIYYGGALLDTLPDATLTQPVAVGRFGQVIAGGGDINGDGFVDLLVGSPEFDGYRGRVYIYLGRPGFVDTPDLILEGRDSLECFGATIGAGKDVNGDGYADFVVGSPGASSVAVPNHGEIRIFFGSPDILQLESSAVTEYDLRTEGQYGTSVAMGDINGDGFADIALTSPDSDYDQTFVEIIYGGAGPAGDLYKRRIQPVAPVQGEIHLRLVSFVGDMNGDGYDDLAASFTGPQDEGVFLFAGGPGVRNTPELVYRDEIGEDHFGHQLAGGGDLNGDGYQDLIIVGYNLAHAYFGGAAADIEPDLFLKGLQPYESLGWSSIESAGDVNGDGSSDLIVGAPSWDTPGTSDQAGAAYLYLSSAPAIVPRILAVADVPADQGGRVLLTWTRSGYDALSVSRVTSYVIERSLPPGRSGFAWEPIGTIQAAHNPRYAFAAPTPNDSSANASGTHYFRVTAATNNPNEYWRSMPVSAHSVDNLAPPIPSPLAGTMGTGTALLHWRASSASDFFGYELFRSSAAGFNPDTLQPIATLPDTSFTDNSLPSVPALYYIVRAVDVHGNRSGPSNELRLGAVGVADDGASLPSTFVLDQNYPNPFNPTTTIRFGLPTTAEISLIVYNAIGQEVATVVNGEMAAGYHEVQFHASHLPSGTYFYTLKGRNTPLIRKLLLIK